MNKVKYHKRLRLKEFSYTGFYCYSITITTNGKHEFFEEDNIVKYLISMLQDISQNYGFAVWAYCFMPDHLHLLIEGTKETSNIRRFISMFKQKSGYWFKQNYGRKLWQENYYEHILRKQEDTQFVAYYIFNNPVRKGLVDNFTNYPFLGSFMFNIKEFRLL